MISTLLESESGEHYSPCTVVRSIVENKMAPKPTFTMGGDLDYGLAWLGEMGLGLRPGA